MNVVCGVKRQEIVVINGKVFFNSANYNGITNVTRADLLTTSSAGITVFSLVLICHAG